MSDAITAAEFAADEGLEGWRVDAGSATARFRTGSFAAGVRLVVEVGRLADEADHHPDVDLRYPHVDIALTSHDIGGLSRRDATLARSITHAALALGIPAPTKEDAS